VLPPRSAWTQIQNVRSKQDKSFARWMPHVNLIYPFVPNSEFNRAIETLKPVLAKQKPFTVRLEKIGFYHQKTQSVVFVKPDTTPPTAIMDLQRALQDAFPSHNDLLIKAEAGFHGNVTLGQFDKETVEEQVKNIQKDWSPITFDATEVHLISRSGEEPFDVRHTIQIGDSQPTGEFKENPKVFTFQRRPMAEGDEAGADRRAMRRDFRENTAKLGESREFLSNGDRPSRNTSTFRGFEGRPRREPNPNKLFVSNLGWNVDNNSLADAFKDFGATRAYIVMDRVRERSRGYGFVEFESAEKVQQALEGMQGRELEGRQLLVKIAVPRPVDGGDAGAPPPEMGGAPPAGNQ
jgi:2'-5' RNA ligase